ASNPIPYLANPASTEGGHVMAEETIEEFTETYVMSRMGGLAAELVLMFAQAADLPDPQSATVYGILQGHVHDQVTLCFPRQADSAEALAAWASVFGGVIQSNTTKGDDGPELWVKTTFPWMHLRVEAFAHIPIPHADYPHEPGTRSECAACMAVCFCGP